MDYAQHPNGIHENTLSLGLRRNRDREVETLHLYISYQQGLFQQAGNRPY